MGLFNNCLISALLMTCVSSLIIPDEITSLLSLVYSNIPPIKKGTDSRVGVGFRLGPHADFQVVLELGPQSNTQPLGPSADTKRRRNSEQEPAAYIGSLPAGDAEPVHKETLPTNWLSKWRTALRGDSKVTSRQSVLSNRAISKPSDPPSPMPVDANPAVVSHLSQLFAKNATNPEGIISSSSSSR